MEDKEDKEYVRLHLQLHGYKKENGYVVNKIDRPNMTPTVRAICAFAVYFSVFRPFLSLHSCL